MSLTHNLECEEKLDSGLDPLMMARGYWAIKLIHFLVNQETESLGQNKKILPTNITFSPQQLTSASKASS